MKGLKKIQAFTINEMLVVLLLTSIVVGMAFGVLQLVQSQMNGIAANYERSSEMNLLRQSLWIDFNQCDGAWYDLTTNELLFFNGLRDVSYRINEDHILKGTDTFQVTLVKKTFFFKGLPRISGEIDALDIVTSKESGSQRLFVSKKNAATSYLND